jgi:hypothetical protein
MWLYAVEYVGQSFMAHYTGVLKDVRLLLLKLNNPTGNATVSIYAHSGTYGQSSIPTGSPLAVSDVFDVSSLTASPTLTTIPFSGVNKITLNEDQYYCLVVDYHGGNGLNQFIVCCVDSDIHSGNMIWAGGDQNWQPVTTNDIVFYVYTDLASESASPSASVSFSPSVSESASISASPSVSISSSLSLSPSVSVSASPSFSPSKSVSASISASISASPSVSVSASISKSISFSPSKSKSSSPSRSVSSSISASVSASISQSVSASLSISPSASPSSEIKAVGTILRESIKKANTVSWSSIKKIGGLRN